MDSRIAFWTLVGVYYAVVFAKALLSSLAKRERRRQSRMSQAERESFRKYWKWCF